jgi:polyferredoxin
VISDAVALITVIASLVFLVHERELIDASVTKDRSTYRTNSEGKVANVYRLKITNATQMRKPIELRWRLLMH